MSILSNKFELCPRCKHHQVIGFIHGSWGDYGIEKLYAQVRCLHCGLESDHVAISAPMTAFEKELCIEAWNEAVDSYYDSLDKWFEENEDDLKRFFNSFSNVPEDDDIMINPYR